MQLLISKRTKALISWVKTRKEKQIYSLKAEIRSQEKKKKTIQGIVEKYLKIVVRKNRYSKDNNQNFIQWFYNIYDTYFPFFI